MIKRIQWQYDIHDGMPHAFANGLPSYDGPISVSVEWNTDTHKYDVWCWWDDDPEDVYPTQLEGGVSLVRGKRMARQHVIEMEALA